MLRTPGALIAVLAVAGTGFAGCGSSSSTRTVPARQTPLMSNPDTGSAVQQGAHPAAARGQLPSQGAEATGKVVKARPTPDQSNDEHSSTGAKPFNPCTLVSLTEAQSISGGAITKMTEAPLGPSCIYSASGHVASVTLAVETESFGQVTRHLRARKHMVIGGRRSVCGRLGAQMLLVPLGRSQLLNVTAPCGIAQRFATFAVSRLSA